MAFLDNDQKEELLKHIEFDESKLRSESKHRDKDFHFASSIKISRMSELESEGWEVHRQFKSTVQMKLKKSFSEKFEDDIWTVFYKLGFNVLNKDSKLFIPWEKESSRDKKQVDVFAADTRRKIVFLIECKSSTKENSKSDFKDEFDLLRLRVEGMRKAVRELFEDGDDYTIKHIFAVRNIRVPADSVDFARLKEANSFLFDDNTYKYVQKIIKNYKDAAVYQFLPLVFKGVKVNNNKIEIPAIKSVMAGLTYYVFSIEPKYLLQIGYVLHRVKANTEIDDPTYQRLLVPSRLKGIRKFVSEEKGFFPNSVLLNFKNSKKNKIEFSQTMSSDGPSRLGVLKIPNVYSMAYIIDGQHRVYGYTGSEYRENQSIPVVAFEDLAANQQLKIFMDINQNQKAVSPSLKLDLEEDLNWDSKYDSERMNALRSSIVKYLGSSQNSILYNQIQIGEDDARITFTPFNNGIKNSDLLPKLKGKSFNVEKSQYALYDFVKDRTDTNKAMLKAKKDVGDLILGYFQYLEEHSKELSEFTDDSHMILSTRGIVASLTLIGALNKYLTDIKDVSRDTPTESRLARMKPYLSVLFDGIKNANDADLLRLQKSYGAPGEKERFCYFLSLISQKFKEFEPPELTDWNERNDKQIQDSGKQLTEQIERTMKSTIISNLQILYGNKWDMEIGKIKSECRQRKDAEDLKAYNSGIDQEELEWTHYFQLNDYKNIISKHWTKSNNDENFNNFESIFTIDIGYGSNSKEEKLKWIDIMSSHRNGFAHIATKDYRINREDLNIIQKVASSLNINVNQ